MTPRESSAQRRKPHLTGPLSHLLADSKGKHKVRQECGESRINPGITRASQTPRVLGPLLIMSYALFLVILIRATTHHLYLKPGKPKLSEGNGLFEVTELVTGSQP